MLAGAADMAAAEASAAAEEAAVAAEASEAAATSGFLQAPSERAATAAPAIRILRMVSVVIESSPLLIGAACSGTTRG